MGFLALREYLIDGFCFQLDTQDFVCRQNATTHAVPAYTKKSHGRILVLRQGRPHLSLSWHGGFSFSLIDGHQRVFSLFISAQRVWLAGNLLRIEKDTGKTGWRLGTWMNDILLFRDLSSSCFGFVCSDAQRKVTKERGERGKGLSHDRIEHGLLICR